MEIDYLKEYEEKEGDEKKMKLIELNGIECILDNEHVLIT